MKRSVEETGAACGNLRGGRLEEARFKLKTLAPVALTLLGAVAAFLLHGRMEVGRSAVAPFASVDCDAKGEQIADGISENLVNELSRFSEVRVKSREAVAPTQKATPKQWGANSGHGGADGPGVALGHNVSVVVELIDPRDNTQIWGEIYHLTNSDPIELEDGVSRLIIEEIQVRLSIGLRSARRRGSLRSSGNRPVVMSQPTVTFPP
jgi:TolB-like protein